MRAAYVTGSYTDGLRQRRELVVEHHDDGSEPMVELVERSPAGSSHFMALQRTVSVPLTALGEIVPHFERRLGIARPEPTADLVARYVACVTMLVGHKEQAAAPRIYGQDPFDQARDVHLDAGVSHMETERWLSSGRTSRTGRYVLLHVRAEPGGYNRTLYVEVTSKNDPQLPLWMSFCETYQRADTDDRPRLHTVRVEAPALDPLVAVLAGHLGQSVPEAGDDLERRLVAAFAAMLDRGELGFHLPYRQNRDRVHALYAATGLTCLLSGSDARLDLLGGIADLPDGDGLSQRVSCWTPYGDPVVEFHQLYFRRGNIGGSITTGVRTPLSSLDQLVEFFERRLDLPAGPGTEDQLLACFSALLQRGELGGALPRSLPLENAARVTEWFAAAGVPYELTGECRYSLLNRYRELGNGYIALNLTLNTRTAVEPSESSTVRLVALRFSEDYDYPPQGDDGGREYSYDVKLAETPMEPLVGALEQRLGVAARSPELDERLVACFRALVTRGELSHDLPLKANRDLVAAILRDLGDVTTDGSVWINSD